MALEQNTMMSQLNFVRGFAVVLVGTLFLMLTQLGPALIHWRDPKPSESFALLEDRAITLLAAQEVLRGAKPNVDFLWMYGPMPLYAFASLSQLASGVSFDAFYLHQLAGAFVQSLLILLIMVRVAGPLWGFFSWFTTALGWPGTWAIYNVYEAAALLLLVLLWVPLEKRALGRSFLSGSLLGLMQWVKFGTAFFAGFALMVTDWLWLLGKRRVTSSCAIWMRGYLGVFAGFAILQLLLLALLFGTVPSEFALLSAWPSYLLEWYASYVGGNQPWRVLAGGNMVYFVTRNLPLLIAVGGCFLPALIHLRRRVGKGAVVDVEKVFSVTWLGVVFLLGIVLFFKHEWNTQNYKWMVAPGIAAWISLCGGWKSKTVLVALLLPACFVNANGIWSSWQRQPPATELARFSFPNGQVLWMERESGAALEQVIKRLKARGASMNSSEVEPSYLALSSTAGIYFYGDLKPASRHSWFFPGVIREFERAETLRRFHACPVLTTTATVG